jgi:hypothetical protein
MARRQDSPYSDETGCVPYPDGFCGYSEDVSWVAQNEGSRVMSVGLYLPTDSDRILREENADDVM